MIFYAALLPPRRTEGQTSEPVMVASRLSWLVLLCGWVGLLLRGCPVSGLLAGGASVLVGIFAPLGIALPLLGGMHLFLALSTPDLRQWELRLRGYRPIRGVYAPDRRAALLRWMDRNPACSVSSVT